MLLESEFILQPPIAGVTSITDTGTVVMAAERESLDAAWTRILDKAENPDTGGNVHDYERWVVDGFYKDYGVKIGKGVQVKNSVIMQNCELQDDALVENVICDKNVVVSDGKWLKMVLKNYPLIIEKNTVI